MLSPGRFSQSLARPNPIEILSEEHFLQAIKLSETMFVLLDIHEEWLVNHNQVSSDQYAMRLNLCRCGPNKAILPYYNQLWLDVDDASKRILLASICPSATNLKEKLKALAPNIDFDSQGCRPLFLVVRNGNVVANIDGLNPPMIDFYLKLFLPEAVLQSPSQEGSAFAFQ